MTAIGRNEPCPCGSGRKYKKCCLVTSVAPYTQADRDLALQKLLGAIHPDDMVEAHTHVMGKHLALLEQWTDPALVDMAECALQGWVCFDELADDETHAGFFLEHESGLSSGVRRYIEAGSTSAMKLYEVVDVTPGSGFTLRDLLDGGEVRVRERSGSRSIHVWDLLAARVMAKGASGQPEIDCGLFPLRGERVREPLLAHLRELRAELDDAEFKEACVPIFFDAWIGPGLPKLVNFDGEATLLTTVHFDVVDEAKLISALEHAPEISDGEGRVWTWVGNGKQREEPVTRAFLRLEGARLRIETNSRERGEAVRALVEQLAGDAARYRITEHQDVEQAMLEAKNAEPREPLPEELREPAREAVLDLLTAHYERWLDEPVPLLGDITPRAASADRALRERVAGLIEGLERLYEKALGEGDAAYDPTWMWEELQLDDLARGRSRKRAVPKLPHEVIEELEPEVLEVAAEIADRARRLSAEGLARVIDSQEVEDDLGFHRLVRATVRDAKEDGSTEPAATADGRRLAAWIGVLANFELHLRKMFWVDEGLAWMLGATGLDITGDALRPPFASFALVFTDRYALGLAERLLADHPAARLRGRILSVLTVYVTSSVSDDERGEMRIAFAADAHDGGWPELVVRDLTVRSDAGLADILRTISPGEHEDEGEALSTIVASPPLRGLLGLVFNAILYATSADAEAVPGDPRGQGAPPPRRRRNGQAPPTSGIFRLPGKIDITSLRQLKRVRRGASDVQAMRRCMVRGHWRQALKGWKDERPRWIKPYWRGPGTAAVVEREYRLK
jgi:hypothetical protein